MVVALELIEFEADDDIVEDCVVDTVADTVLDAVLLAVEVCDMLRDEEAEDDNDVDTVVVAVVAVIDTVEVAVVAVFDGVVDADEEREENALEVADVLAELEADVVAVTDAEVLAVVLAVDVRDVDGNVETVDDADELSVVLAVVVSVVDGDDFWQSMKPPSTRAAIASLMNVAVTSQESADVEYSAPAISQNRPSSSLIVSTSVISSFPFCGPLNSKYACSSTSRFLLHTSNADRAPTTVTVPSTISCASKSEHVNGCGCCSSGVTGLVQSLMRPFKRPICFEHLLPSNILTFRAAPPPAAWQTIRPWGREVAVVDAVVVMVAVLDDDTLVEIVLEMVEVKVVISQLTNWPDAAISMAILSRKTIKSHASKLWVVKTPAPAPLLFNINIPSVGGKPFRRSICPISLFSATLMISPPASNAAPSHVTTLSTSSTL